MASTKTNYSHTSVKKRLPPTREEQHQAIENSMVALLKRTRTTLQVFQFAEELCADIAAVLARHTEYENGRPSLKHLKDFVRDDDEESAA